MKAIQKINQIIVFSVLLLSFGYANPKEKDFVVDCDKCVIEVSFTEEEVERFKKEMGEDNFYDAADDANYYSYTLRKYLKVNGIESKHISRLETPYTKLVFPNESIDIARLHWIYEYYLYQKGKKPEKLKYLSDPQEQINAYFNITNPKYPKENE